MSTKRGATRYNGPAIRAWREQRGFKPIEFAKSCDITAGHLTNIEKGRSDPSDELAHLIARRLGLLDLRIVMITGGELPREPVPVND